MTRLSTLPKVATELSSEYAMRLLHFASALVFIVLTTGAGKAHEVVPGPLTQNLYAQMAAYYKEHSLPDGKPNPMDPIGCRSQDTKPEAQIYNALTREFSIRLAPGLDSSSDAAHVCRAAENYLMVLFAQDQGEINHAISSEESVLRTFPTLRRFIDGWSIVAKAAVSENIKEKEAVRAQIEEQLASSHQDDADTANEMDTGVAKQNQSAELKHSAAPYATVKTEQPATKENIEIGSLAKAQFHDERLPGSSAINSGVLTSSRYAHPAEDNGTARTPIANDEQFVRANMPHQPEPIRTGEVILPRPSVSISASEQTKGPTRSPQALAARLGDATDNQTQDHTIAKLAFVALLMTYLILFVGGVTNRFVVFYNKTDFFITAMVFISPLVGVLLSSFFAPPSHNDAETPTLLMQASMYCGCGFGVLFAIWTLKLSVQYNRNMSLGILVGVFKIVTAVLAFIVLIAYQPSSSTDSLAGVIKRRRETLNFLLVLAVVGWVASKLINGKQVYLARNWDHAF